MVATEERVMSLLSESNPIPDIHAYELGEIRGITYLATIQQRSSIMTQIDDRPVTISAARRRMPVTAIAVAIILILGTVAWLAFDRNETGIASGDIAVVHDFAEAVTSGVTDLSEYVTDEATFAPMSVPLDTDLASFWAGLDTALRVSNCEQTEQVVRCDYEWTDRIREVQDRPEFGTLTVLIDGSRIADIGRSWDQDASGWLDAGDPVIHYLEWLDRTYPGWELELDWIGEPVRIAGGYAPLAHDDPVRNARYAEVLTRHLDEYAQHLTAIGGIAD